MLSSSAYADTIFISNKHKTLTFNDKVYPIAVGKPKLQWQGIQTVSNKKVNPTWYPTEKARKIKPALPKIVHPGIKNPLGTRALYLGNTIYRIHGTNDPKSIGKAASSGCFRMLNSHVEELYSLVPIGTKVVVR